MRTILVTGAGGLVGSAVTRHFANLGWYVVAIDNNERERFFGAEASTRHSMRVLFDEFPRSVLTLCCDVANDSEVDSLFGALNEIGKRPDAIVHAAAQPSHDKAADIPKRDFMVNACGTLNFLQAWRENCHEAPFVFLSTNKVYGDSPNNEPFHEEPTRYEWDRILYGDGYQGSSAHPGWCESRSVDQTMHSLFGCSKLAADLYVQEYGRYFGMPTVCLRAGCLTGGAHAGAPQHGFLSYLAKCIVRGIPYTIEGYGGKQVRDNLHADDVARFCEYFIEAPRSAEVYNIGGGFENSCSILEAILAISQAADKTPPTMVFRNQPRKGDHRVYYSDLRKIKEHYPRWSVTRDLPSIYAELVERWRK